MWDKHGEYFRFLYKKCVLLLVITNAIMKCTYKNVIY